MTDGISQHFQAFIGNQFRFSAEAFLFLLMAFTVAAGQQPEVIDNQRVTEMVVAGIGDSVLIPKIATSRLIVDASEAGLLRLKAAGVSDAVIVAMLNRAAINGYISHTGKLDRQELAAGAELKIATIEKISGRKVREGEKLRLMVAEDLKVGDRVVVAKDTPVAAVVSKAKAPGMVGRGGQLSISIESTTTVDGQSLKLRAAKSGQGGDNFGTAITLSYIMGIGLLIPGKNAEIKAGTIFPAYTDETVFVSGK